VKGRLEAKVTCPGWSGTATNATHGAAAQAWTVAAGDYFPGDLLTALQTALNAVDGPGWTVTASWGEAGTGLITINCSSTPWALTFTQADFRTFLGLAANIGSRSTAKVCESQSPSVWLPGTHYSAQYDLANGEQGAFFTDMRSTRSPRGHVQTLFGNRWSEIRGLRWEAVTQAYARANAGNGVNTAFELWWQWTQLGEADGGMHKVGSPVRLYGNADSSINSMDCRIDGLTNSDMPMTSNGYLGLYRVEIPSLVIIPS